ncbi:hypothetical protein V8F33_011699 [Rhypophila sp. PSN 637]
MVFLSSGQDDWIVMVFRKIRGISVSTLIPLAGYHSPLLRIFTWLTTAQWIRITTATRRLREGLSSRDDHLALVGLTSGFSDYTLCDRWSTLLSGTSPKARLVKECSPDWLKNMGGRARWKKTAYCSLSSHSEIIGAHYEVRVDYPVLQPGMVGDGIRKHVNPHIQPRGRLHCFLSTWILVLYSDLYVCEQLPISVKHTAAPSLRNWLPSR